MTHNNAHARIGNPPMKPRAIVWDLFGDHLRYIDNGRVPMRALNQLLERVRRRGEHDPGGAVPDAPGRLVHHLSRRPPDQLRAHRPEHPDARRGPDADLRPRPRRLGRHLADGDLRRARAEPRRAGPGPADAGLARVRAAGRGHLDQPAPPAGDRAGRARRPVRHPDGPAGKPGAEPGRGPRDGVPLLGPGRPRPGVRRADQRLRAAARGFGIGRLAGPGSAAAAGGAGGLVPGAAVPRSRPARRAAARGLAGAARARAVHRGPRRAARPGRGVRPGYRPLARRSP